MRENVLIRYSIHNIILNMNLLTLLKSIYMLWYKRCSESVLLYTAQFRDKTY